LNSGVEGDIQVVYRQQGRLYYKPLISRRLTPVLRVGTRAKCPQQAGKRLALSLGEARIERVGTAPPVETALAKQEYSRRTAPGTNVLHLTPNWNVDVLLEAQRGTFRALKVARVSPPSARIVDVQLVKRSAFTGSAAEAIKVVRRPVSNLEDLSRTGSYAPYQAWARAQEETAQASLVACCLPELDVYA
jgi:hypothetical protein